MATKTASVCEDDYENGPLFPQKFAISFEMLDNLPKMVWALLRASCEFCYLNNHEKMVYSKIKCNVYPLCDCAQSLALS